MSVLIFTVGQNGYASTWRKCVLSQRRYAKKWGFEYIAVTRPLSVPEPALSAWLKVPLTLAALRAGYEWVVFLDADCEISESAPDFRDGLQPDGAVFAAAGRTGRFNSGVIFTRNGAAAESFFGSLYSSVTDIISEEDRARLKYENGNFIHIARKLNSVVTLDLGWNNSFDPDLDDNIRHYAGDMRKLYDRPMKDRILARILRSFSVTPTIQPSSRDAAFKNRLEALTARVKLIYPQFAGGDILQDRTI